ncbi:MAG TPA: hypothetical protein VF881_07135 [Polyangiaceae bacterium]
MAPVVSGVLFLAVFEAWSTQARADVSPTDRALAQSLFDQARHLMTAGKTPEACPKFAESYRLDPAGGTLLNLAVCHETEGKTATAWSEFKDAKSLARRDGRKDREKLANDHIQSLESKLSRITISVPPSTSDAQGLEVKLQGASIGKAAWGTSMPVDPGPLEVSASAPGKKPWSTRVNLAANGDVKTIEVGPLVDDAPAPVAAPPRPAPVDDTAAKAADNRRTLGLVVGGAGGLSLIIGSYFGLQAFSSWSDRNDHCPNVCDAEAVTAAEDAKNAAMIANVGIGLGLVGIGVGTYLFVTSRPPSGEKGTRASVRVLPDIGSGRAGLSMGGSW